MRVLLRAASSRNAKVLLSSSKPVVALRRTTATVKAMATAAPAVVAAAPPGGKFAPSPSGAPPVPAGVPNPFGANAPQDVTSAIAELNAQYDALHLDYEKHFWGTKMALQGSTAEQLATAKTAYEAWLGSADNQQKVAVLLECTDLSEPQRRVLEVMKRTFDTYISPSAEAAALKAKLNELEAELSGKRNSMKLGLTKPSTSEFVPMSSVQLRNTMRVAEEEAERKAAYEGVCEIGPFVAPGLAEIVKLRNKLARAAGYEDYYDFKVQAAEQMSKAELFAILDGLEQRTRPIMEQARKRLAAEKGEAALEPWNQSQALAGDTTRLLDPYFPFENAVDAWARSFAALGLRYNGGTMNLDLCDRPGLKYSNGFAHWPECGYRKSDGTYVPARCNFTSLATPSAVGSGFTALTTLLHEGGHAAHFAGIDQLSPLCAQERPPFSVALAETQSMTLDAFGEDAGWLARYAVSREGEVVPWPLIEAHMRATKPYEVFALRAMLAVSYFEKALYELPEEQVTAEKIVALADEVEKGIQGGLSPRPLMSVPHILADEASAYYHGYTLASMAVHQNRAAFRRMLGTHDLADRPEVGAWLSQGYFVAGNTRGFLPLVEELTGAPLSADAWVADLETDIDAAVAQAKKDYDSALQAGPRFKTGDAAVEQALAMRVVLSDGDVTIADSAVDGGLGGACDKFKAWVRAKFFNEGA